MDKNIVILVTFCLYLLMMLGIGAYFYFKTKNLSDYILGGRGLGKWVTSLSAQASDMSGWLLMGLPGAAFLGGVSNAAWIAIGLAVGTYFNWKIVAKKLRTYTEKFNDSITLSSYFENRFEVHSRILRVASSVFILIFFLFYTASSFVAGGKLLNSVFNIEYRIAVLIGTVIIITYTFLGGFLAVCWTDLIQGILMFFAIIALPIMVIVGGVQELGSLSFDLPIINSSREVIADTGFLSLWSIDALAGHGGSMSAAIISIISSLAWGLGYFGQPHILVRFMAVKDPEEIKRSRLIAMIWVVISLAGAVCIGILGRSVLDGTMANLQNTLQGIEAGSAEAINIANQMSYIQNLDGEYVFMELVMRYAPLFISGVLLSAILAAVMSTADSQLLVTASSISEDLYRGIFRKKASEKELVWVSRLTIVAVAVCAYFIAMDPNNSSVLALVAYAWAGFGATFGPVVLMSLFYRKTTGKAAFCGMVTGGVTTIIWKMLAGKFANIAIFGLYEIIPGFLLALSVIYLVSNLDTQGQKAMLKKLESMNM